MRYNTEMKVTPNIFDELEVGLRIHSNADGAITTPEFYEATIVELHPAENFILVRRDDGDSGSGPDGLWIIRCSPNARASIYIPTPVEPRIVDPNELVLGDIFTIPADSNPTILDSKYVFLFNTSRFLYYVPYQTSSVLSSRGLKSLDLTQIAPRLEWQGKKPFMNCQHINCTKSAKKVVLKPNIMLYCSQHYPSDVIICHDCGCPTRANYITTMPRVNRIFNSRQTRDNVQVCATCAEHRREQTQVIKQYNYKPEPKFFAVAPVTDSLRSSLFAGCELEMEVDYSDPDHNGYDEDEFDWDNATPEEALEQERIIRERINRRERRRTGHMTKLDRIATVISNRYNKPTPWFYLKHDGSLSNGFELVTEPATYEAHRTLLPWKPVLAFCHKTKVAADNTDTCGLHIHVGKHKLDEAHRIRLGYFVNSQRTRMEALARRTQNEYARFKPSNTPIQHYSVNTLGGKYEALNWGPRDTVEFRLFRGTTDHDTLLASLELTEACILFTACEEIDVLRKKPQAWQKFLGFVSRNGFHYLPSYLRERGVA